MTDMENGRPGQGSGRLTETRLSEYARVPTPSLLTRGELDELARIRAHKARLAASDKSIAADLKPGDIILWAGSTEPRGVLACEVGVAASHALCPRGWFADCYICNAAANSVHLTLTVGPSGEGVEVVNPAARCVVDVIARATPETAAAAQERLIPLRARADQQRAELAELRAWERRAQ